MTVTPLKTVVVIDYQNVHLCARDHFLPGTAAADSLISPGRFARRLIEVLNGMSPLPAELVEAVVFRGLREHVDWAGQRIWVVSKGSRTLMAVPGSPEAFGHLALYFDQFGTPGPKDPVWRTRRGESRQLTYWAMRRILQRANEKLGTNWSLHDLRHTAATRMANDPELTLPEVQAVLRHRHLSTTESYLQPRIEELHDKLQEHYGRPRQERRFDAGYAPEDIEAVFGG